MRASSPVSCSSFFASRTVRTAYSLSPHSGTASFFFVFGPAFSAPAAAAAAASSADSAPSATATMLKFLPLRLRSRIASATASTS